MTTLIYSNDVCARRSFRWDVALVAVATAPPCTFGLYYVSLMNNRSMLCYKTSAVSSSLGISFYSEQMTKVSGEVAALLADAYSKG